MGKRGPLPDVPLSSDALKSLAPPRHLGPVARKHWTKHAERLVKNGMLCELTSDMFCTLCELWQRLQDFREGETSRTYLDCLKAYQALAKNFRMLPSEKIHTPAGRYDDFEEI